MEHCRNAVFAKQLVNTDTDTSGFVFFVRAVQTVGRL